MPEFNVQITSCFTRKTFHGYGRLFMDIPYFWLPAESGSEKFRISDYICFLKISSGKEKSRSG